MAEKAKASGLQVDEDRDWQETLWTAQRIAWGIMAAIILLALLGATGKGGPLASASAETSGARIEYPRISRWQSSDQLVVQLPGGVAGEVEVELSRPFVELFSIQSVEPEPVGVAATGEGHRFRFDVRGGASGGEPRIVFNIKAAQFVLSRQVAVQVGSAPPAQLTMTILP